MDVDSTQLRNVEDLLLYALWTTDRNNQVRFARLCNLNGFAGVDLLESPEVHTMSAAKPGNSEKPVRIYLLGK